MARVVTFGEIMLRLAAPGHLRFSQAGSFEATFGGGEANVAVSLAAFGQDARFVSALPQNDIADACLAQLRGLGVNADACLRCGERLGIYYIEKGAVCRPSKVIYDRAHSAISEIRPGMIDWKRVFEGADWFHWTGITPAISRGAADVTLEALEAASELGLKVSCDLNYRKKLWKYGKQASEVMPALVERCDVIIGNEEDAEKVFGISAEGCDAVGGNLDSARYEQVCRSLMERFPRVQKVAITQRKSLGADHNRWSAVLYNGGGLLVSQEYDITHIVDRVGGGDSFAAGLIYGLSRYGSDREALEFAVAASCLKHTIEGDYNRVSVAEVETLMGGDKSGRVSR